MGTPWRRAGGPGNAGGGAGGWGRGGAAVGSRRAWTRGPGGKGAGAGDGGRRSGRGAGRGAPPPAACVPRAPRAPPPRPVRGRRVPLEAQPRPLLLPGSDGGREGTCGPGCRRSAHVGPAAQAPCGAPGSGGGSVRAPRPAPPSRRRGGRHNARGDAGRALPSSATWGVPWATSRPLGAEPRPDWAAGPAWARASPWDTGLGPQPRGPRAPASALPETNL